MRLISTFKNWLLEQALNENNNSLAARLMKYIPQIPQDEYDELPLGPPGDEEDFYTELPEDEKAIRILTAFCGHPDEEYFEKIDWAKVMGEFSSSDLKKISNTSILTYKFGKIFLFHREKIPAGRFNPTQKDIEMLCEWYIDGRMDDISFNPSSVIQEIKRLIAVKFPADIHTALLKAIRNFIKLNWNDAFLKQNPQLQVLLASPENDGVDLPNDYDDDY